MACAVPLFKQHIQFIFTEFKETHMLNVNELNTKLTALNAQLEDLQGDLNVKQLELDNFDYVADESEFNNHLNGIYGTVECAGVITDASTFIADYDPTAYRCMKSDYEANCDLNNCEEYNELKEEVEDLENQISDIEKEIEDLETEINDLEQGE